MPPDAIHIVAVPAQDSHEISRIRGAGIQTGGAGILVWDRYSGLWLWRRFTAGIPSVEQYMH